jgi:phage terminase large subunit GpA-like protein
VPATQLDPVSLGSLLDGLTELSAKNYADWHRMDPVEWATGVRRMPDGHGGTHAWSFDYFPPCREMYLSMFEPGMREVVFQMFSRGFKSDTVLTAIGYRIDQRPARILIMWPTVGQGEKFSKDNLMEELIHPTGCLNDVLGEDSGKRRGSNTILHKRYPGGLINIFGANVAGEMRRAKGNFLYAAEIDTVAPSETDEGDPLRVFKMRGSEFPDTIEIYESYPSVKNQSRIATKYEATDKRQWFVTCLSCGGEPYVMNRSDLRYDTDHPELARMECPRCHELLDDQQRYAMMMGGDPKHPRFDLWKPTAAFTGRAGFQANSMLWPHPVNEDGQPPKYSGGYLHFLAQYEIDVQNSDNPERERRVMVNTIDAEPYEPEHMDKVEHTDLYNRREDYDPRECLPDEVLLVVFGADLQADRAEIKFKGFGLANTKGNNEQADSHERHTDNSERKQAGGSARDATVGQSGERSGSDIRGDRNTGGPDPRRGLVQSWGLDYLIVRGSPLQNELWERIENILRNKSFPRRDGTHLQVACGLFDSGYKPDYVYTFCRKMLGLGLRVYPCAGATTLGKPIVTKPIKRGNPPVSVYEIGTHEAKDVIYQRLDYTDPARQGYMHFPKTSPFSENYFKQLTIEDSTLQRGRDGKFYRFFFKKDDNDRNEAIDTEVYADAAERILRPNYAKLFENLRLTSVSNETKDQQKKPEPVTRQLPRRPLVRGWKR